MGIKKRRIISMVLAFIMVFTLIPLNKAYARPTGNFARGPSNRSIVYTRQESQKLIEDIKPGTITITKVDEAYDSGYIKMDALSFADPMMPHDSKGKSKSNYVVETDTTLYKLYGDNGYDVSKITIPTYTPPTPVNGGKSGSKTATIGITTSTNSNDYREKLSQSLVTEAKLGSDLKALAGTIALYFADSKVLPPSKDIVGSLYNDRNNNGIYDSGDLKIHEYYSIDYEEELQKLQGDNLMSDSTSVLDIRNMVALYLFNSSTYTPIHAPHNLILMDDVEAYKSAVQSETYIWPTNIPVYENIGGKQVFKGSYNLAKDSHIVDGRNNTITKFLEAYNKSYDLAYYNDNRDEQGLSVKDGMGSQDMLTIYPLFVGGRNIAGQNFKTLNNNYGGTLDFELFAMSLNHVRTVIAFEPNISSFVNYNKISDYATLGRGIFNAPITNLLYTGGVANEPTKDFAEYVGYYARPYDVQNVINTLGANYKFLDKPILKEGIYLKDITGESVKDDLVNLMKQGIKEIDDKTEARSFNPEVLFAYYNINNGKLVENGSKTYRDWFIESDMDLSNEGFFFHDNGTTKSGKPITRIKTTQLFQDALNEGKLKKQQDAYLDHFTITEFPTMYTWGQGMGMRNMSGMWYIDVALAPMIMLRDVKIKEESTFDNEDGSKTTVLKVRFDSMPYLPEGATKENILVNVLGKDVEVISMANMTSGDNPNDMDEFINELGGEYQDFKAVDFSKEKYTRKVGSKDETLYDRKWDASEGRAYYEKYVSVDWKLKPTATKDSKIIFTANLAADDAYAFMTKEDGADATSKRAEASVAMMGDLDTVNYQISNIAGETVKYLGLYQEMNLSNNLVISDIKPSEIEADLSIDGYEFMYNEGTGKAAIRVLGMLNGRDLVAAKGELPVEVKLDWESTSGESGTQTLTSNDLKTAGTGEQFVFEINITPPVAGGKPGGTFTIEINPKDVPKETNRDNNKYTGVEFGEINVNTLDFDIYTPFSTAPVINDGAKTNIDFKAFVTLNNVLTTETTKVTLYKSNGTVLDTRNVTIVGGNTVTLDYSLPIDSLTEGLNGLRIAVNTDFLQTS